MTNDADTPTAVAPIDSTRSPWLTVREAAARAKCGTNLVYASVKAGRLRAARLGVRNDLRIHESWVDAWITSSLVVDPDAPGDADVPLPRFGRRR